MLHSASSGTLRPLARRQTQRTNLVGLERQPACSAGSRKHLRLLELLCPGNSAAKKMVLQGPALDATVFPRVPSSFKVNTRRPRGHDLATPLRLQDYLALCLDNSELEIQRSTVHGNSFKIAQDPGNLGKKALRYHQVIPCSQQSFTAGAVHNTSVS